MNYSVDFALFFPFYMYNNKFHSLLLLVADSFTFFGGVACIKVSSHTNEVSTMRYRTDDFRITSQLRNEYRLKLTRNFHLIADVPTTVIKI